MKNTMLISVLAASAALILAGCSTSDSAQPAKSATMSNTFDDCIIVVATQASISNRIVRADGTKDAPSLELFTVTQALESSGTETYSQTATQTPTTDVKPDLDVHYNDAVGTGGSAAKGLLETLTAESAATLRAYIAEKKSGVVTVTTKDGQTQQVQCKDGVCSPCEGGACSPPSAR